MICSPNCPHGIWQTSVFMHASMFVCETSVCLCVCVWKRLCAIQGRMPGFNIISLCERGSTISLIKNRQHEEAIWRCTMREDRLSVLWPNKCFHSIKAIRLVWSGLVGMLSLPRSIDYRQLSAGLAGKMLLGSESLPHSVPGVVFSSFKKKIKK